MDVLQIPTLTHGRVLVEGRDNSTHVLVGCHGYGQNAAIMLEELRRIPGADAWRLVSVQALHRFYTRGDQAIAASWMTREDREQAIADNIEYLDKVLDALVAPGSPQTIVYVGFSQGASMAARAAVAGRRRPAGLVMLGGDIPPDVREHVFAAWPPTLIGCGNRDEWYGARVESDVAFLRERGVAHELARFQGGHEINDELRGAVGDWLARQVAPLEL